MKSIEAKMNLSELTEKIKIEREFDAEPIGIGELAKYEFSVYDYELRYKNVDGVPKPEWLRMLVGILEYGEDGLETGKVKRYTCKTESTAMVDFMAKIDAAVQKTGRSPFPLEHCRLENSCGYMFKGSTNRESYMSSDNMKLPNSSLSRALAKGMAGAMAGQPRV